MSCLLIEEEDAATVQEALAMIDAWDDVPILSNITPEKVPATECTGTKRERSRERDFRRRQRLKEERLQLQMQAQRMEMHLQRLRQNGDSESVASVSSELNSIRESSVCVSPEMQQERVEAELLNMSLRKAVAAEIKWSKSLRAVLDKHPSMETVSLDGTMRLSASQNSQSSIVQCSPSAFRDDPAAVRREIIAIMDQMYYEAKATIDPMTGAAAAPPSLGCHYNVRLNPKIGSVTELTSETPLNCSLDSAREVLTTMFAQPQPTKPHLAIRTTRVKQIYDDGGIEKQFTVDLGGSRINESLDGIGLLRKHTEDDCEMIIWAAISFHPSGKISFRETSWMVAARSAPSSTEESVIRLNYRLNAEKANGCTYINGEHIDQVRNHALAAIGTRMKTKHNMLQRKMLVETGQDDLASFLG